MGFSMGGSSSQNQQASSGTKSNTYSPEQTGLMAALGNYLTGIIGGSPGGTTPDVTAMKTASADTINKNSASVGDRSNRFLSSRGFGQSGLVGESNLRTELGRQSDLAANESSYAGLDVQQKQTGLLAALNYAFNPTGQTTSDTTSGTASGSKWGVDASAAFAF
jgi:hypothetical protein